MPDPSTAAQVRFGPFTLDVRAGELRKGPTRLKAPDQSVEILKALLERPGQLVTREELRQRLWPANHYVDFEHGLNAAVRRLRDALGDSADTPKYIETLPRRGYRFISTIESAAAPAPPSVPPLSPDPTTFRKWRFAWHYAAVLIVLAAVVASLIVVNRHRGQKLQATSSSNPTVTQLTFEPGLQMNPSLSPDGKFVAYASNQSGNFDIWVRPVEAGSRAVQITTDPAHDWQPDWSPTSNEIVFRSERKGGGVYVVPALGGVERRVADFGYAPRWSPDGTKLLLSSLLLTGASRGNVLIVDVQTGASRDLDLRSLAGSERLNSEIGWYPDGKRVTLFMGTGPVRAPTPHFITVDVDSGTVLRSEVDQRVRDRFVEQRLWHSMSPDSLVWSRDRRAIYFVGNSFGVLNVWAVDVDPQSLAVIDGPRRLTTMSERNEGISISTDGSRMVVGAATRNARVCLYTLDSSGRRIARSEIVSDENLNAAAPALTPDGRKLALTKQRLGSGTGRTDLWERVVDSPTSERFLLANDISRGEFREFFRWSPDGTRIAYQYTRPTPPHFPTNARYIRSLMLLDVATLKEEPLTTPVGANADGEVVYGWSPDGSSVVVSSDRARPGRTAIALIPVSAAPAAENHAQVVTDSTEYNMLQIGISPNQKWICFQAQQGSTSQLAVISRSGGSKRLLTGKDAWVDKPRWSADGRTIFFVSSRTGVFNLWGLNFDPEKGTPIREPFQITQFDGLSGGIPADVTTVELGVGGRHIAVPVINPKGGIWLLENFRR